MPRKLVGAACGVDFVTEDGAVLLLHRSGTITIGPDQLDDFSQLWIAAHRQAEAELRPPAAAGVAVMLTVGGKRFRCECKANVLTSNGDGTYRCNGDCGRSYADETAVSDGTWRDGEQVRGR